MGSKPFVRPPRLGRGSRIALVAPAGPLLERDDITRAEELCRALDYEPVAGPHAGNRYGYLAGTDDERLADLNAALRDDRDRRRLVPPRRLRRDPHPRRGGFRGAGPAPQGRHRVLRHHRAPGRGHPRSPVWSPSTPRSPAARCPAFSRRHFERVLSRASAAGAARAAPSCQPTCWFPATTASSRCVAASPRARSPAATSRCCNV